MDAGFQFLLVLGGRFRRQLSPAGGCQGGSGLASSVLARIFAFVWAASPATGRAIFLPASTKAVSAPQMILVDCASLSPAPSCGCAPARSPPWPSRGSGICGYPPSPGGRHWPGFPAFPGCGQAREHQLVQAGIVVGAGPWDSHHNRSGPAVRSSGWPGRSRPRRSGCHRNSLSSRPGAD